MMNFDVPTDGAPNQQELVKNDNAKWFKILMGVQAILSVVTWFVVAHWTPPPYIPPPLPVGSGQLSISETAYNGCQYLMTPVAGGWSLTHRGDCTNLFHKNWHMKDALLSENPVPESALPNLRDEMVAPRNLNPK